MPYMYDLIQMLYDYILQVTNRGKGLDLVGRIPEKLWMQGCNSVQEVVIVLYKGGKNARRQNGCLRRTYK